MSQLILLLGSGVLDSGLMSSPAISQVFGTERMNNQALASIVFSAAFVGLRDDIAISMTEYFDNRITEKRPKIRVDLLEYSARDGIEGHILATLDNNNRPYSAGYIVAHAFPQRRPLTMEKYVVNDQVERLIHAGYLRKSDGDIEAITDRTAPLRQDLELAATRWANFKSNQPELYVVILDQTDMAIHQAGSRSSTSNLKYGWNDPGEFT